MDGLLVGAFVLGESVGFLVGLEVGSFVTPGIGCAVGEEVMGLAVGFIDGVVVGDLLGSAVGLEDGDLVGSDVVGFGLITVVGDIVGFDVGGLVPHVTGSLSSFTFSHILSVLQQYDIPMDTSPFVPLPAYPHALIALHEPCTPRTNPPSNAIP